jgi:hypothetical protein
VIAGMAVKPDDARFGHVFLVAEEYATTWAEFMERLEASPNLTPNECCPEILESMDFMETWVYSVPGFREFADTMDWRGHAFDMLVRILQEARWRICRRTGLGFDEIHGMSMTALAEILGRPSDACLSRLRKGSAN